MTALLVERAGQRVAVAGNIGPTMLDTLAGAIGRPTRCPRSGCSSCRASSSTASSGFEPDAAAVLNITQDHLDWHGTMDAYARPRRASSASGGVMVINRDDPRVAALVPIAARPGADGQAPQRRSRSPRAVVRFGLDAPQRPGDFGLVVENGMAWLVRALEADETRAGAARAKTRRSTCSA